MSLIFQNSGCVEIFCHKQRHKITYIFKGFEILCTVQKVKSPTLFFFLLLKFYIKNDNLIVKASLKRRFKKWFTCMASDLARLALFMTPDSVLFRSRSIVARYRMMLQIITAPPFPISIDVKLIWNMWLLNVVGMYVGWSDWLVCA